MPHQALDSRLPYPTHQIRGMPGLLSSVPPSPNPSQESPYFYKTYPDSHYRGISRSFSSPSSDLRADHPAPHSPYVQFAPRPDKQREQERRQSVDSGPYRSAPEAGSSSTTRTDHHGSPRAERASPSPLAKYECSYCGKGFNRPSSLKVRLSPDLSQTSIHVVRKTHLNTHTGAKRMYIP